MEDTQKEQEVKQICSKCDSPSFILAGEEDEPLCKDHYFKKIREEILW